MKSFIPKRIIFEPSSLEYPLGQEIYNNFKDKSIEIIKTTSNNVGKYIPGDSPSEQYVNSKRTIFVTINKVNKLDVCKPSSDCEFSLVGNCPGNCEYCYL